MNTILLAEKIWTLSGNTLREEWTRTYQSKADPAYSEAYLQVDLFLFWCRAAGVSWDDCADRRKLEESCTSIVNQLLAIDSERKKYRTEPLQDLYQAGLKVAAAQNPEQLKRIFRGVFLDASNDSFLNTAADILSSEPPETVLPLLRANLSKHMTDTQKAVLSITRTLLHACPPKNYQLHAFIEEWRLRLEKSRMLSVSLDVNNSILEKASEISERLRLEEKRLMLKKEKLMKAITASQFRLYDEAVQKSGFLDPYTVEAQSLEEELIQSTSPMENERLRKQLTETMLAGQFGRDMPALERLTALLEKEQQILKKIKELRSELKQVSREKHRTVRQMHILRKTWHLSQPQKFLSDTYRRNLRFPNGYFPGNNARL